MIRSDRSRFVCVTDEGLTRAPPKVEPRSTLSAREIFGGIAHAVDEVKDRFERLLGVGEPDVLRPGGVLLPRIRVPERELRLLLVGDTGTGKDGQMHVAAAMTADGCYRRPHFTVNLGDLVYENGVERKDDPALEARVAEPYEALEPVYLVAGNHDHRGQVSAVVEFAEEDPAVTMPARYYGFGYDFGDRSADFFVLDTTALEDDPAQLHWFARAFEASTADYKIVLGHHPIHSGGEHGDTEFMKQLVLPIVDGKADMVAAGHEHDQQVLNTEKGTLLLISGAGGKVRKSGHHPRAEFMDEGLGFSALTLGPKGLELEVIDAADRKVLHRTERPLGGAARRTGVSGRPELARGLPWAGNARSTD